MDFRAESSSATSASLIGSGPSAYHSKKDAQAAYSSAAGRIARSSAKNRGVWSSSTGAPAARLPTQKKNEGANALYRAKSSLASDGGASASPQPAFSAQRTAASSISGAFHTAGILSFHRISDLHS